MALGANLFAQTPVERALADIAQGKKATLGVAVMHLGTGESFAVNGAQRFPMQSVFKFHIALAVLDRVDKGALRLEQVVPVSAQDVAHELYSPMREKYPKGTDKLTLDSLIRYTVAWSDNTGCDVLLRLLGGPKQAEQFIHSKGIKQVAIANNEEEIQGDWQVQYQNWTTPTAAVALLEKFAGTGMVSEASTRYLMEVMLGTTTGAKRLKGLLPVGTPVAHKTGWSGRNKEGLTAATNNIGILFLPDGSGVAIAAFVRDSLESPEENEALIARAAKVVWDYFVAKK